jgi:hypothetical protein
LGEDGVAVDSGLPIAQIIESLKGRQQLQSQRANKAFDLREILPMRGVSAL